VLLRRVARRYLPADVLKPRKQGFTVPVNRWLHGPLGDMAFAVFSSGRFRERGIIDPERARGLIRMHRGGRFDLGHRIWAVLVLETWCRIWIDGEDWKQGMEDLFAYDPKEGVCR
jgi:asparagine synthase (glutamine-hydrolysing)